MENNLLDTYDSNKSQVIFFLGKSSPQLSHVPSHVTRPPSPTHPLNEHTGN